MHFSSYILAAGAASLALAAPASRMSKRASNLQFFGVNESGPEFGEDTFPGKFGTEYNWPTLSTIDTFIASGMNTFRINVLMERLVPDELTGDIAPEYFGQLQETVSYITERGAYALIAPHNFGRYYKEIITYVDGFGAFWATVATPFKGNSKVIFDTSNEYHDMPGRLVADLNQAAIDAIRGVGAISQYIAIEGNAYTGAWTWTTQKGTDGLTNAETLGDLTDPQGKILYEMHQYLDSDGSGTHEECVSTTIGSERLAAATEWLRSNGKTGLLGEYAGAVNPQCEAAVKDLLEFVVANSDVWSGALWWAAGPWWGDYMFSVEPTDGPAYDTYVPLITQYA